MTTDARIPQPLTPAGLRTSLAARPGSTTEPHHVQDPVHLSRHLPRPYVDEQVRNGQWVRLRRGVYIGSELAASSGYEGARRRAVATARAVAMLAPPDRTVSHGSAALLHGLPTWTLPTTTHLSQPVEPRVRRGDDVARHVVEVPDDERVVVDGLWVTTLERTVVDCLCALRHHDALVVVDAALRRGASLEVIVQMLASRRGRRGVRQAWAVLDVADAGAESPGESLLRFVLLAGGLPRPETQVLVATPAGDFWADLGWRERLLLVEYDGLAKYEDPQRIVREKQRDEALRGAGATVIHVTRADLDAPHLLVARVRRELFRLGLPTVEQRAFLLQVPTR